MHREERSPGVCLHLDDFCGDGHSMSMLAPRLLGVSVVVVAMAGVGVL